MKRSFLLSVALLLAVIVSFAASCNGGNNSGGSQTGNTPSADASASVKVITINMAAPTDFPDTYIKYNGQTPADYTMDKRAVRLYTLVDFYSPDILMLQEINGKGFWWDYLIDNDDSLIKRFPKYDYVGTTNLGGGTNGAGAIGIVYNQIYFNTNKFEKIAGGTFFARDNKNSPENPLTGDYEGPSYVENNTTTCSWAVLRDKASGIVTVYGVTHLVTRPNVAQCFRSYGQARNVTEGLFEIAEKYKWGDKPLPIVVGGDFNGDPKYEVFYAYPHMIRDAHYVDSQTVAPVADNSGTARIFGQDLLNNGIRIDYIFNQGAEVTDYLVLKGTFIEDKAHTYCEYNPDPVLDGTQYDLTDHLPVYAKLKFTGESYSVAPDDYYNTLTANDVSVKDGGAINATSTKIVFDTPEVLNYIGNNINKGFVADIVETESGNCLKLTVPKSRIDPTVSIDYKALMQALNITPETAANYSKVKVEYRYVRSKSESIMYFGASTASTPITVGVNTAEVAEAGGAWTSGTFDFSYVNKAFWTGDIDYFAFTTSIGLMAGDGVYVRSVELVK